MIIMVQTNKNRIKKVKKTNKQQKVENKVNEAQNLKSKL